MVFESVYAPAGAEPGALADGARGRAYARWTLAQAPLRPVSAAEAVVERVLRRGFLVPAPDALCRPLAALLGSRLQAGLRAAFQLQLAALRTGARRPRTDLHRLGRFTWEESEAIARLAFDDLERLRRAAFSLFPAEEPDEGPVFISFTGAGKPGWDCVFVEDDSEGAVEALPVPEEPARTTGSGPALRALMSRVFGHAEFRPGQREAVEALLAGRDAAALLPTGAGKSLIFQLAALCAPGTAVVVEPLLSVVDDQRRALARLGVTAVGGAEDLEAFAAGRLLLLYVSPERFETGAFKTALREAAERGVSFVAIDEAHCVSPWGHDFRPALLAVGRRARRWAAGPLSEPPLAALTGTASRAQLDHAVSALRLRRPVIVERPLARPELAFEVERCGPLEHVGRLRRWIAGRPRFGPGLVFCPTVDGPLGAAGVWEALALGENVQAGCFTGRAPRGQDPSLWERRKRREAERFLAGRLDWLCCTSAFGLGVDVPRGRWTVHLGLADSLESFLQQAGRAGRDGRPALCRVVLHVADERRAARWLSPEEDWDEVWGERESARRRDDVWAALALHRRGFPGRTSELGDAVVVAASLGRLRRGAVTALRLPGQSQSAVDRALSRLESAGLVEVWRRGRDEVEVLACRDCGPGEAAERARAAVEEIYDVVERARRASLGSLLACALEEDFSRAAAGPPASSTAPRRR